jgi:hypothetical protein
VVDIPVLGSSLNFSRTAGSICFNILQDQGYLCWGWVLICFLLQEGRGELILAQIILFLKFPKKLNIIFSKKNNLCRKLKNIWNIMIFIFLKWNFQKLINFSADMCQSNLGTMILPN